MNKIDIVQVSLIQQKDKQYCVTTKLQYYDNCKLKVVFFFCQLNLCQKNPTFGSCCCYHQYFYFNGTDKCLACKGWFLLAMDYILQFILIHTILVNKWILSYDKPSALPLTLFHQEY